MSFDGLADAVTAAALDLDWLARAIAPVGEYGRACEAERGDARAVARDAAAIDRATVEAVQSAMRALPDIVPQIARASVGDILDDAALLELTRFCDAYLQMRASLAGTGCDPGGDDEERACREVSDALAPGRAGAYGFYLDGRFDEALRVAREDARAAQAAFDEARRAATLEIAGALGRPEIGDDEFVVMRSALPAQLPRGVRVIREAPTYLLCACELDEASLAALSRRDAAASGLAAAEGRVRARLSAFVRERVPALDAAARALGALDRHLARVRFAQRYDCVVAEAGDGIAFEEARYLPLLEELEREGRDYAPISLDLASVAVLTGPNMGGKSVALRTCGFVALCAAIGLPVPAKRARVAPFARIAWLGISAKREGGLLSSFAREVVRLREILTDRREPMLVLVDEFARTTTPQEGRALLIALLARLRARGSTALVSTHLAGIAAAAGASHYAIRGLRSTPPRPEDGDLARALAALAGAMDHTLAEVTADAPPQTDALALAELLGLDPALIRDAYGRLRE